MLERIFSAKNTFYYKNITVLGKTFKFINIKKFNKYIRIKNCSLIPANKENEQLLKTLLQFFATPPERLFLVKNFNFENETFKADYENLTRGLDEKSKSNIDKSLEVFKMHNKILNTEISINDIKKLNEITTPSEEISEKMISDFQNKIKKIDDNLYQYMEYLLPECHFESSVFYYKHNIDKLKTLDKIKNKDIIDVGGFIGDSAIIFSKYTNKNVYSFEASPENFKTLQKTLELNKTRNVLPQNIALGAKPSEILFISGESSSKTVTTNTNEKTEQIESTTLDEFVEKNNIEVGLIKVDIEGYEQKFLKGAENTIKTQKPALLISIYHNIDDYMHIKPIIESWNLGYTFKIRKPDESTLGETLLIAEVLDEN